MYTFRRYPMRTRSRQRGVVLAVGLILLLVMTLIMIVAMSGSILQERMAGAMRSESIADVGADSALRDGELWVWEAVAAAGMQLSGSQAAFPLDARSGGTYQSPGPANAFRTSYAWELGGVNYGTAGSINFPVDDYYRMAQSPSYVIETLGDGGLITDAVESHEGLGGVTMKESRHYYRITGRSTGGTEGVVRGVESTFSISLFEN
jgi:type IV pilus assembly protein PilX